jgi:hypothetical protein
MRKYKVLSNTQANKFKKFICSRKSYSNDEIYKMKKYIFPELSTINLKTINDFLSDIKIIFEEAINDCSKNKKWNIEHINQGKTYYGFSTKTELMTFFGKYVWNNRTTYIGQYKNSNQHGFGYYEWETGGKYFGLLKNDEFNNLGIYKSGENIIFYSNWENDKFHGERIKIIPESATTNETYYYEYCIDNKITYYKEIKKHIGNKLNEIRNNDKYNDMEIICLF